MDPMSLLCRSSCLAAALFAVLASPVYGQDDAQILDELRDKWRVQREEIQTARVHVALFRYVGKGDPILTENEARAFLARIPKILETSSDPLAALKRATGSLVIPERRRRGWTDLEIIVDGPRTRNIRTITRPDGSSYVHDNSFDGEDEVQHWSDSQQATVYKGRSRLLLYDLRMLRSVPPPDLAYQETGRTSSSIELWLGHAGGGDQMQVDLATGLVTERIGAEGNELYQYEPIAFSGDIVSPRLTASVLYSDGMVRRARLLYVIDGEFNVELGEDAFDVAIPSSTTIVDHRGGGSRPETHRLSSPTPDTIALANELPTRGPPPRGFPFAAAGLLALGLLLVVIGALIVRGRLRAA